MTSFALPAEALKQLGYVADQLTKLQNALPEYLWLDTQINILIETTEAQPGLDNKASVGVFEFNDFDEYHYVPFSSPRRRAITT